MAVVDVKSITVFLGTATENPSALIIEGEAGIGKTTLWLAGVCEVGTCELSKIVTPASNPLRGGQIYIDRCSTTC